MAKLILNGATSGSITLESPAVSGSNTLSLPANTGTVITTGSTFAGTGPAFSAKQSANQTLTSGVNTKVQFNTEIFDTNTNYDNTTNYRFTPTVDGYYQVTSSIQIEGAVTGGTLLFLYKNGSVYNTLAYNNNGNLINPVATGSCLVYVNGSTDYLEIYVAQSSSGSLTLYGTAVGGDNQFSAFLARSA